MKKIALLKKLVLFTLLSVFVLSCDNDDGSVPMIPGDTQNIVEKAQDTDILSSLVAALSKADENDDIDLIGTLSGDGPFTVFAPTNEAFTNLLAGLEGFNSLQDFDTPEEKSLLATILTFHVISGTSARSSDLIDGQTISTVQGEDLVFSVNGGVFIQDPTDIDAGVVSADIETNNGIVHVIDKVLVPQAVLDMLNQNVVERAQSEESLSLLVDALIQADAGLVEVLNGDGPFTVFAPTNDAFADLLDALGDDYNSLDDFDTADEKELLAKVLTYHVVSGTKALSTDLSDGQTIATVQGENVMVNLDGGVFIEDATDDKATVAPADIKVSNGVVHIVDKVLLPQEVLDLLSNG